MNNIATEIIPECWDILKDTAPYVLFGFLVAGLFKALIPENLVSKHLGRKGSVPALKASPLARPLCSCWLDR